MEWNEIPREELGKTMDEMARMHNSNRIAYENLYEKYNSLLDAVIASGEQGAEGYRHERLLQLAAELKKD